MDFWKIDFLWIELEPNINMIMCLGDKKPCDCEEEAGKNESNVPGQSFYLGFGISFHLSHLVFIAFQNGIIHISFFS